LALVLVGSWIGIQRRTLATLEDENRFLGRHSSSEEKPGLTEELFPERGKSRAKKTIIFGGLPEWQALVELVAGKRNGRPDARGLAELDKLVKAMGSEELVAKIEEIMSLDLEEEARSHLIDEFLRPLIDQDPELAMRRLFGQLGSENPALSGAWGAWSKKDLGAATAWFDEQIAAGKVDSKRLDGSDGCRANFEGQLVKLLLVSDPAAAARRMSDLPVDMRAAVIDRCRDPRADEVTQKAWVELVRSQLPAKHSLDQIASSVPVFFESADDLSKVTKYMEAIAASPAERSACVSQTIDNWNRLSSYSGKVTIEGIEALRTWADAQEPGLSNNLTRDAIGNMLRNNQQSAMTLEQVEAIVSHYQGTQGGDEMLAQALEKSADLNHRREYIRALASQIPDEERRARILKKVENR
jgi:hypothetical protein